MKEMLADKCQAVEERLEELEREKAVLDREITDLERTRRRLKRPTPTARIGFCFNDPYSVTK